MDLLARLLPTENAQTRTFAVHRWSSQADPRGHLPMAVLAGGTWRHLSAGNHSLILPSARCGSSAVVGETGHTNTTKEFVNGKSKKQLTILKRAPVSLHPLLPHCSLQEPQERHSQYETWVDIFKSCQDEGRLTSHCGSLGFYRSIVQVLY